ncbi:hypothetical protein COU57_07005 [Candidatus Pacearchaeota archaeon CG10_big_fil_rev_8_21_14_0_10_32_14]|nr:MAG: hypothetical protein COU57_07005 [Candidatus Pacearchaeota archaeon CG10_big_fil_rev_8_21_14_0_10_32_14]
MRKLLYRTKKGQVWIESVTYTLVVLALIGAVLFFVKPKLEEMQDKAVIDQTYDMLNYLDQNMNDAGQGAQGNVRTPEFTMKRGKIEIYFEDNTIIFTIDKVRIEYSEPGRNVKVGDVNILTIDRGKYNTIKMSIDYNNKYDLENDVGTEDKITITKASTLQKLSFKNYGKDAAIQSSTQCNPDPCVEDTILYTRIYCADTGTSDEAVENPNDDYCFTQDTRPNMKVKVI